MNNEEKAREIAQSFRTARMFSKHPCEIAEDAAQQMAEWKDVYYKKLLDLLVKSGANADIITNYIENCIEL